MELEKEFAIASFNSQVEQMSEEQAKLMLVSLNAQYQMLYEMHKELMRKSLGISG